MSSNDSTGHKAKMEKRKALHDKKLTGKTEAKGLLMVHTGPGKGKSSAAFGMALRCVGHNMRVGVVQFIKGAWDTGERRVLETFPELVTFKALGEGFTWETQDKERDIAAAKAAWEAAKKMITDPTYAMVILDEMNIALRYDYLDPNEVIDVLVSRRPGLHVVVTGRNVKPELIEAADLVTEMTLVKHPFRGGVKAQPGVEF